MSEPTVCPNCAKLASDLLKYGREAYDRGVDDALKAVIEGLEVMKSRGLELCWIDDLIRGFQGSAAECRAERKI